MANFEDVVKKQPSAIRGAEVDWLLQGAANAGEELDLDRDELVKFLHIQHAMFPTWQKSEANQEAKARIKQENEAEAARKKAANAEKKKANKAAEQEAAGDESDEDYEDEDEQPTKKKAKAGAGAEPPF